MTESSLPQHIAQQLKAQGISLAPNTRLLVGYSGGMDSTALLDALGDLQKKYGFQLTAAYYNHHWRPSPPRELPILHKTTEALGIPLVIIEADRSLAKTETVAREHRYRQLTQLAADLNAHALLSAHHADDQVETVLFRILRGTGTDGLSGIQKRLVLEYETGDSVPILRPLLDIPKEVIRQYSKARALDYFEDPGNQNTRHQRNLIRQKILPLLQEHFPQVKNSLYKIGLLAEGDSQILDAATDKLWETVYHSDEKGYYLDSLIFNQLDLPYQRRILKRYFTTAQVYFDFQTIENTLAFIRGDHRNDLSVGLRSLASSDAQHTANHPDETMFLSLYKNRLRLLNLPKTAFQSKTASGDSPTNTTPTPPILIPIPGLGWSPDLKVALEITEIPEGNKIKLSKAPVLKASALLDPNLAYVDLNLFIDNPQRPQAPEPLTLRTRQPGDKFHPMGMTTPMRLKKFLINKGIPRFERDSLPLLAAGQHILWIPGIGLSEYVKVSGKPTHRLQLTHSEVMPEPTVAELPALETDPTEPEPPVILSPALLNNDDRYHFSSDDNSAADTSEDDEIPHRLSETFFDSEQEAPTDVQDPHPTEPA